MMQLFLLAHDKDVQHRKFFGVNKPLQYKIKVTRFHSAAAYGLATYAFQKSNWGQFDPMVDRGLRVLRSAT